MTSILQKSFIIAVAVAIVGGGLLYLQREWTLDDLENITVSPEVENEIWTLLERSTTAGFWERTSLLFRVRDMGRESLPVLVSALEDEDPRIRAFAANALEYSDNLCVAPYLEARLNDEQPRVRRAALTALGRLGAVETVPAIILVLNDEDNFTRSQAAHVLGTLKDGSAVVPLIKILEDDPYRVARQTAANSLGEIGDERAVAPLTTSLEDVSSQVRGASFVALKRIAIARSEKERTAWENWWNEQEVFEVRE